MAFIEDRHKDKRTGKIKPANHKDRKRARWRVRYRGTDDQERARSFQRRIDAEQFMHSTEVAKIEGRWVDPRAGKITLREVAESFLRSRPDLRSVTQVRDSSLVRNHAVPAFGSTPIVRIERADVQRWVARLSERLAPATVKKCYGLLAAIFSDAVDHKLIPASPCVRIRLPRAERAERRFLGADQVEVLADAVEPLYRALIHTAAYLGPRWGELAGLRRDALDLPRRQVAIEGAIGRVDGRYRYTNDLKNDASRRTLRLPGFLVEILARHLETAPESEYVFCDPEGGFLNYDNFRLGVWRSAVEAAGLAPLTFHELRHTAAALMVDMGADPLQVQRRLGHSDIKTTLGLYGHLFPNREDELNDALERAYLEARTEAPAAPPRPQVNGQVAENTR